MALTPKDFPLAETAPDRIIGRRGKPLGALTLEAIMVDDVTMDDLGITPRALMAQAEIARAAGRAALASNFERGADLVSVPDDCLMETYEMLRPGRVQTRQEILDRAALLRRDFGAEKIAQFLEEAAEHYVRRGMVSK